MRYLIFSDLQATDGGEVCFSNPSVRLQDWRVDRFLKLLSQIYKEKLCDGLIDLGDTTDDRSAIPVPTINTLFKGFVRFPEDASNYKIIGNHEQYTRNATIDVGELFTPFFTVYSEPSVLEFKDHVLVFAPYPASHEELNQWLLKTSGRLHGKKTALLGHFQVVGSLTRGGQIMEGIPKDTLDRFDIALLGHVHKPQQVGANAWYVGSPFQQNWGESGEAKRVGILNTQTMAVDWIPIEGFPVYKTLTVDDFLEEADERSENRYEVILKNSEEATRLYTHPLASRTKPRYDFAAQAGEETTGVVEAWDEKAVMERYLSQNPWTLDVAPDEMLETGLIIAGQHNEDN